MTGGGHTPDDRPETPSPAAPGRVIVDDDTTHYPRCAVADLTGDLTTQAVEPQSVTSDGQSATARPTGDLIKAQQFLDAKNALAKRRRGVLFTKLVTPGPLVDEGRTGQLGSFDSPGGY